MRTIRAPKPLETGRFLEILKTMRRRKPLSQITLRKSTSASPIMVSKVTVKSKKYTNISMGTVQAAIAHDVLDAVRGGVIPEDKV